MIKIYNRGFLRIHRQMKLFEQIVGEAKLQRETSEFYEPEEQVRHQQDQHL